MNHKTAEHNSGASETTRFFCTRISSAAGVAGELCTTQRKEPDMAKRENEGKKEIHGMDTNRYLTQSSRRSRRLWSPS